MSAICCIVGGGPAGMMLGYLLARAGIEVMVLEKHADFLRDFRGDTVHPSTLEVMHEVGVLEEFLKRPHQRIGQGHARIGKDEFMLGDMAYLRTRCRFMALMPQWHFLDFLAEQGRRYPTFNLQMQTEVTGLLQEQGEVTGVRASTPAGSIEVRSRLVVGADGRNSVVREHAGLAADEVGAPIDVLWMRLTKHEGDPEFILNADRGKILVLLDRGTYWQCGLTILKGSAEKLRAADIEELRSTIVEIAPFLHDRVAELRDWSDVKLLTVRVNRLRQWYGAGVVCIGDAAHAMSPVGGVGINLAIQDAVAAANALAKPLREGQVSVADLQRIQHRREFPTRLTQRIQAVMRNQLGGSLHDPGPRKMPLPMRLLEHTRLPRRIRTRFLGLGIRPEHVKTPDVLAVGRD